MEHAGNYMDFTQPLEFETFLRYRNNEQLRARVAEFRADAEEGIVKGEEYHNFFKSFGPYLDIEKPLFLEQLAIYVPVSV